MNKFIILLLIISLFSCEKKKPSTANQTTQKISEVKDIEKTVVDEIKNVEEVKVSIQETKELIEPESIKLLPKSVLFGDVKIDIVEAGENIQITSNNEFVEKMDFPFNGKTDAFIETDVDGNGFNEFYIVSNTGDLAAFSSYNNKSFGEINIAQKPYSFYKDCTRVKFWEAKNKKLSITFENGVGDLNTVRYKLVKGEASHQLIAE